MRFDLVFLLIGSSLILIEFVVPGLYIAALGIGALTASAFAVMNYPPLDILISFLVGAGGTAVILKSFYKRFFPWSGEPNRIIGKRGKVLSVSKGIAKVKVGRQQYLAKGRSLKKGVSVNVTGKKDTYLLVEK